MIVDYFVILLQISGCMEETNKKYKVQQEEISLLAEPIVAAAKCDDFTTKPLVDSNKLLADGYLTVNQSKKMIERKIYNHFHRP